MADKQPSASKQLTQRQLEILVMLAKGMSSKEIGHALGLSHKTVDVHRGRIMERLGVRGRGKPGCLCRAEGPDQALNALDRIVLSVPPSLGRGIDAAG